MPSSGPPLYSVWKHYYSGRVRWWADICDNLLELEAGPMIYLLLGPGILVRACHTLLQEWKEGGKGVSRSAVGFAGMGGVGRV